MRSSKVQSVDIRSISNSSAFVCGSTGRIISKSSGLYDSSPIERENIDFADYPVFTAPLPVWSEEEQAQGDDIRIQSDVSGSVIRLGHVKVLAISLSTTFQIGSNFSMDLESRVRKSGS
ncbi:spore germination protein GerPE [Paenibacillus sp. DMB20]|uniref:spore germination protein GerPE n=1 Tax=Paenibacillus sp. DMB20 TaxID=1642570 RepID=UPI00128B05EB|nr:spore germination protein GerPE [Paenibacillus sp. DMB20]